MTPLQQFVGRDVDEFDFVGPVDNRIGNRLPNEDAGYFCDGVPKALDMLHVEGCVDIDARTQQLLHVLPALRVARPGGVCVRQLVEEKESRLPG